MWAQRKLFRGFLQIGKHLLKCCLTSGICPSKVGETSVPQSLVLFERGMSYLTLKQVIDQNLVNIDFMRCGLSENSVGDFCKSESICLNAALRQESVNQM